MSRKIFGMSTIKNVDYLFSLKLNKQEIIPLGLIRPKRSVALLCQFCVPRLLDSRVEFGSRLRRMTYSQWLLIKASASFGLKRETHQERKLNSSDQTWINCIRLQKTYPSIWNQTIYRAHLKVLKLKTIRSGVLNLWVGTPRGVATWFWGGPQMTEKW